LKEKNYSKKYQFFQMSDIKPCSKKPDWNWKIGEPHVSQVGENYIQRTYFDCGEYFWDGEFNVVKFPKGMSLYHGSSTLVNANVEYPVGKYFYDPVPFGTDAPDLRSQAVRNDNIPYQASKFISVDPSYYADPQTAVIYSATKGGGEVCGDKCIFAYKLRQDTVFYLMDDGYNIAKLLSAAEIPDDVKRNLSNMFVIEDPNPRRRLSENPLNRFSYDTRRDSRVEWDIPFAGFMCREIIPKLGYAGMAAPIQYRGSLDRLFHLEFIFCNATKYLERDLESSFDWQKKSTLAIPSETKKLLDTFKRFKTINVNVHGGNLYEHTVWILLNYEENVRVTDIPDDFKFLGALAALFHDIGKMDVQDELNKQIFATKQNNFVYYSLPKHPFYGSEMLLGRKELYTWPKVFDLADLEPSGVIDLSKIIVEASSSVDQDVTDLELVVRILAFLVLYHWEFGVEVVEKINRGDDPLRILNTFIRAKWSDYKTFFREESLSLDDFKNLLRVLILMSAADVAGFSSYGKGRFARGTIATLPNERSRYFPFIKNVPQKYRGSNLFTTSNFLTIATDASEAVKNMTSIPS